MASINISELRPAGSELFQDGESFLNELNDQEMSALGAGGDTVASVISQASVSVGISVLSNTVVSQQNNYPYYYYFRGY